MCKFVYPFFFLSVVVIVSFFKNLFFCFSVSLFIGSCLLLLFVFCFVLFYFFRDISPNTYVIEAVGFSDLSMILVNLWIFWVALLLKGLWCKLYGFLISRLSIPRIVVHGKYHNFRIVFLYFVCVVLTCLFIY